MTDAAPGGRRRGGGPLSELELEAWRGFLRTHATLTRELDDELRRAEALSLSEYDVLVQLADAPGGRLRMAELASAVVLSRSGLTRLVDGLERKGLVSRERCPDDARGFHAVITKDGLAVRRRASRTHLAGVRERFLGRLSTEQLEELAGGWRALD